MRALSALLKRKNPTLLNAHARTHTQHGILLDNVPIRWYAYLCTWRTAGRHALEVGVEESVVALTAAPAVQRPLNVTTPLPLAPACVDMKIT